MPAGRRNRQNGRRDRAANTLRRTNLGWEGINTDWIGALRALSAAVEVSGPQRPHPWRRWGRSCGGLWPEKGRSRITISNRCVERGRVLSRQLNSNFIPLNVLAKVVKDFDIVVQCTSVGLDNGEASPIVLDSFFKPEMTVMDLIYSPRWTAFSRAAGTPGAGLFPALRCCCTRGPLRSNGGWDFRFSKLPPSPRCDRPWKKL